MSTYVVSFRIGDQTVNGQSYSDRRDLLIENIHAGNNGYWDETTSFAFVGSDLDTHAFAKKAVQGLSAAHDIVLVFDPSDMSARHFGPVEYADILKSFLPLVKKLL